MPRAGHARRTLGRRFVGALLVVSCLAVAVGPRSVASTIRGPYDDHAPQGVVASDNVLQRLVHPRGYVMLIHGGGWLWVGRRYMETSRSAWFRGHGWGTYDVDYRGAWDSLADVTAAYDRLRRLVGAKTKICVQGQSAGGTLAILLAADHRSIACVISEGGIADLTTMPEPFRSAVNTWVFPGHLWAFSPVREARCLTQPLLMAGSSSDRVVPERRQLDEMKLAHPEVEAMLLPGTASYRNPNFVHAGVTARGLRRFNAAVVRLLARAAS